MSQSYPRPPITEAIIEFRFDGKGSQSAFETAARRLSKVYSRVEDLQTIQFIVGGPLPPAVLPPAGDVTRKMTSPDGVDIVILHADRIALSRRAPYDGWESFILRFHEVLRLGTAVVRKRKLARIGVRFINRIDVPVEDGGGFDHSRYISVGIASLPFEHGAINGLNFGVSSLLEGGKFGFVLNCAKADSPLVQHSALILDIDVYNQVGVPNAPDEIWAQVEEIRAWKNRIFESSVTDEARALFQ